MSKHRLSGAGRGSVGRRAVSLLSSLALVVSVVLVSTVAGSPAASAGTGSDNAAASATDPATSADSAASTDPAASSTSADSAASTDPAASSADRSGFLRAGHHLLDPTGILDRILDLCVGSRRLVDRACSQLARCHHVRGADDVIEAVDRGFHLVGHFVVDHLLCIPDHVGLPRADRRRQDTRRPGAGSR